VETKELSFPIVLWSNADRLEEFHAIDPEFRSTTTGLSIRKRFPTPATAFGHTLNFTGQRLHGNPRGQVKANEISPFLSAPQKELVASVDAFFKKVYRSGAFCLPDGAFYYS